VKRTESRDAAAVIEGATLTPVLPRWLMRNDLLRAEVRSRTDPLPPGEGRPDSVGACRCQRAGNVYRPPS